MNTKETFISLLKSTNRQGVDGCIEELENLGFFTAPASTAFHLNTEGGLVEHSLNVCKVALLQTADGLASSLLEERNSERQRL